MNPNHHIALTDQAIDVAAVLHAAESEEAGAVNAFIGTVRNRSEGRRVVRLHYEAYPQWPSTSSPAWPNWPRRSGPCCAAWP
ncbi:MAG: molybdenum cofactor biosynthesis protein MoaE [Hymenobacter sp.]